MPSSDFHIEDGHRLEILWGSIYFCHLAFQLPRLIGCCLVSKRIQNKLRVMRASDAQNPHPDPGKGVRSPPPSACLCSTAGNTVTSPENIHFHCLGSGMLWDGAQTPGTSHPRSSQRRPGSGSALRENIPVFSILSRRREKRGGN